MWQWVGFGALSGFGGLTDPVVMSVAPVLGAWAWYRLYKSGRRWLAPGLGAVLAVTLMVAPWFIRNYETFHKVIPFRSCLGLEVYFGNNQDSWHWGPPGYHPSDNENEWREYQQLGEIAYTQKKFHEGLAFHQFASAVICFSRRCGVWFICGRASGVSARVICRKSRPIRSIWYSARGSRS